MISIIVPTKNEESGISDVLKKIPKKIQGERVEILVVDKSSDKTASIAKKYARVIRQQGKGKADAMRTGVDESSGDVICFLDGDCTYPPEYISLMYELLRETNANMVVCSKYTGEDAKVYRSFKTYHNALGKLCELTITTIRKVLLRGSSDFMTGFRMMKRTDWYKLDLKEEGFLVETEMEIKMRKNRFKMVEIPIPEIRRRGKSKYTSDTRAPVAIGKYLLKNMKFLKSVKAYAYKVVEFDY